MRRGRCRDGARHQEGLQLSSQLSCSLGCDFLAKGSPSLPERTGCGRYPCGDLPDERYGVDTDESIDSDGRQPEECGDLVGSLLQILKQPMRVRGPIDSVTELRAAFVVRALDEHRAEAL